MGGKARAMGTRRESGDRSCQRWSGSTLSRAKEDIMRKSQSRSIIQILLLTLFMAIFAAIAGAGASCTVEGKVIDPLGAAVANAEVTLLQDRKAVSSTRANAEGNFTFFPVEPGQYLIRATAPGFATQESSTMNLAAAQTVSIEVTLQVGTLRQQVVVSDTGTSLPESQVGASVTVLDQSELDAFNKLDLPEVLRQVPGLAVVQTGERGGTTLVFARGGNTEFNKVLIDGIPANDIGGAFEFANLAASGVNQVEVFRGEQRSVWSRRPGERHPNHDPPGLFHDSPADLLHRRRQFQHAAPGRFAGRRFSPIRLFRGFHALRHPKQPSQQLLS